MFDFSKWTIEELTALVDKCEKVTKSFCDPLTFIGAWQTMHAVRDEVRRRYPAA